MILIELGIMDDGDVVPTVVIMGVEGDIAHPVNQAQLVLALRSLREAGEDEYGRKAPDHACFWTAYPEER